MFSRAKTAILVLLVLFVAFRITSAWFSRRRRSCSSRDCRVSSWSSWSSCSAYTCGQRGYESRSRSIRSTAYCGGRSCPSNLYETRRCYGSASRDCELSSWSQWSVCTATRCGASGTQRSTRHRITTETCGGSCTSTFRKTRTCYNRRPVDCEVSSWSEWSACSASVCDTRGIQVSSRHKTTTEACGGTCTFALQKTRTCYNRTPVDCEVSSWSAWSACNASVCDTSTGIQVSTRHKTTTETCGGTCTFALQKTRSCFPTRKATECQVSPWSQWSTCISTTCELSSIQASTRYKEIIEECKGTCTFTLHRTKLCHLTSPPCLSGGTSNQGQGCNCKQGSSAKCCEKGPPSKEESTHSGSLALQICVLVIVVAGIVGVVWYIKRHNNQNNRVAHGQYIFPEL